MKPEVKWIQSRACDQFYNFFCRKKKKCSERSWLSVIVDCGYAWKWRSNWWSRCGTAGLWSLSHPRLYTDRSRLGECQDPLVQYAYWTWCRLRSARWTWTYFELFHQDNTDANASWNREAQPSLPVSPTSRLRVPPDSGSQEDTGKRGRGLE